ncbi:response regulator receiver protein [Fibrisoma limi BUZ 3]|uniref:Response regulator receiver protein n=1 Tax=Fibrisoma limi BUZ 3 TaxID=1185876 RepID=I2GNH7_9BACT|nr:response regulator [Fibrisoma limi]CCH55455.1 response regulator receiver protein [Fibrisoma limi BUZ 3]
MHDHYSGRSTVKQNFYKASILVVEDNPDHWMLIQEALGECLPEVQTVWVSTAKEAETYLADCLADQANLPKLMLLDLYLPDAGPSWTLIQKIKRPNSPYIRMPIVVFSYSNSQEDINELYRFGGTSYIVKPSTFDQWLAYFQSMRQYWWETVTLPGQNG